MADITNVESIETDKTPGVVWGYKTEMGKLLGNEEKDITLGENDIVSAWAEVNFKGSGQEKVFDKNLQILMRYADGGNSNMSWTNDKDDPWGSYSRVNLRNGYKDIINETRRSDVLDRISISDPSVNPLIPTYVIQGEGSENGERKIYICGGIGTRDKKIEDVMQELTDTVLIVKNGLKLNPGISDTEKKNLGLI